MTATLTAVTVAGQSVAVSSSMSKVLPYGTSLTSVSVVLTADSGTITAGGQTVSSGTAFNVNFASASALSISITDDLTTNNYTLTVTAAAADEIQETSVGVITNVGWFAARCITGDLDAYTAGGLVIPMGNFDPKYVINIMITEGFTGEFDIATKKLKVYKAGVEATKANLATATYSLILME